MLILFFEHPIATNFDTIPPTISPNDQANKLAIPEINVTKAYACIEELGRVPTFDNIFSIGFVWANAWAVIMIMVIWAVKVNSFGKPLPQASSVWTGEAFVKLIANKKVSNDKTITNIKASG